MSTIICSCSSGKPYAQCCEVYHLKEALPQSAELLMRSRYSAYALHLIDYLWDTTHPAKRHLYNKVDMAQWARANHWLKLEIVSAKKHVVEFKAYYQKGLQQYVHHERSQFKKEKEQWYYFSGDHFH